MRMITSVLLYGALIVIGLLLVLVGVLGLLGSRLPETHVSTASIELAAPASRVFELIENVEEMPAWVKDITKVERLPDEGGLPVHRQHMGRNTFVTTTTVFEPPRRILRVIKDDRGPFSGQWDHVIEATSATGSRLTITETGTVKSAIPRAIMHYLMGEEMYIRKFLADIGAKVGRGGA